MDAVVAILNYNGINWLKQFLPIVIEHSKEAEIIIIDNASTDDSVIFLQNSFPDIKIICLNKNHGYAGGYNEGLKQLTHRYFILLNSDIEVTPNWIAPNITILENNDSIAAVQPKILSFHNKAKFEYAGAAGGFLDLMGYPLCRGRIFNIFENDLKQYDQTTEIFWASGACLFIRASDFKDAGGFDASFFAHMEEIDLCWRMKNKEKKIYFCHESKVYHVGGGTLNYMSTKKTYLNFRNNLFILHKNHNKPLLLIIFLRLLLDMAAAFLFLFKGQFKHSICVFIAHLSYYKNFIKLQKIRKNTIRKPFKNMIGVVNKLLVWEHFVKGKNKFTDLFN